MIKFIIKGLLRDKHRSRLPLIVVAIGVMLTVLMTTWITGVLGDSINLNAKLSTGHVKVITKAYRESMDQIPVDLSLTGTKALITELKKDYPSASWVERIQFGGLLDLPDENGETKSQGPFAGIAVDLFNPSSGEAERLNLNRILVNGRLPSASGEILVSHSFAEKLGISINDRVTFIGTTMYGGMTIVNFTVAGTIRYGITALDRGSVIMDISDARNALEMEDACNEILGFTDVEYYDDSKASELMESFNDSYASDNDQFAPVMIRLRDQNDLGGLIDMMSGVVGIVSFVFILVLSVVLWNAGLIGGLRRYGEVGLRLAMGEEKGHIYRSMIAESLAIGTAGSVIGIALGLSLSYLLQQKGLDFSSAMQNATMLMPGVFRTRITPEAWYIGFIPGIIATVLGTMLAGIGIYKRQTARLFKELQS
ncbi:MAG: FtsX-like permease family protein [Bacteroidales bacterium]|nr:FtsX-like permease family protein [Bacteroidales bacterium]